MMDFQNVWCSEIQILARISSCINMYLVLEGCTNFQKNLRATSKFQVPEESQEKVLYTGHKRKGSQYST